MFDSYPDWAREFAQKYLSKAINEFILHGNINDYVQKTGDTDDDVDFVKLRKYVADELFGARDIVLFYDRSGGIQFRDKESRVDFSRAISGHDSIAGTEYAKKLPRDPVRVFDVLEKYFRVRLNEGKSVGLVIDYAETIVPMNEGGSASSEDRNSLVFLLKWAHDAQFLAGDFTVVLLTENLNDLNKNLVQSPYVTEIKIDFPGKDQRRQYIDYFFAGDENPPIVKVPFEVLAQQTAGLSLVNLNGMLSSAVENETPITFDQLTINKKELIEAEAYGLLEFIETKYTLDDVAGHKRVKEHLREASNALKNGRQDVMPMGYLVCGPVGTGKTFIVTSFAGEIGVPMVKLKNFRSQWQGVTEGNLEKILALLKAMAPVAVMIDEADAYLGDRNSGGDSGVSSRVFSQIAQFMSNTENRGRIVWFLMTARPDLMPVDLKRQGRAEEHIALFHPSTKEEREELFNVMKKKTGLQLTKNVIPDVVNDEKSTISGADMEAALTRAKFKAASKGQVKVTPEMLNETFADFRPSTYPAEIRLQTLCAVVECTSKALLPDEFREDDSEVLRQEIDLLKLKVR